MKNIVIKLSNISKRYIIHHKKPTLTESILRFGRREEIWALKDINLEIKRGEKVGIIGDNGAGKTTLLKIITGITAPTEGRVTVNGRVAALITFEAGFHPELTGEENIYLNSMLLGMSKEEVEKKFNKIVEFSELRKFIDVPLYTYSNGMKLRLGFSIALHADPDAILADEIQSSLDANFNNKVNKIIRQLSKQTSFVYATNHPHLLKNQVNRVIWLEKGKIKMMGETLKVIKAYQKNE